MLPFLVAFQVAAAGHAPAHHLSAKDSAKLGNHVRDVQFSYFMDWRQEWEGWRVSLYWDREADADSPSQGPRDTAKWAERGLCPEDYVHTVIAPTTRPWMLECPGWLRPVGAEPADEQRGIDSPLPDDVRDTVRARRVSVLQLLDSAAYLLPGDAWLAGQRVRMHLDQNDTTLALRAATECRAAAWWCGMLRGYVRFYTNHVDAAALAFDSAQRLMPADTLCRWNDLSTLLPVRDRPDYQALSCAEQAQVNERIWWLAVPLYAVRGNPRRTEHYARRVLIELHAGNDADEREDWRDDYTGPAMREVVLRYGWPTTMWWNPPSPSYGVLPGWERFDIHSTYLGLAIWPPDLKPKVKSPFVSPDDHVWHMQLSATDSAMMTMRHPDRVLPLYWRPQFHMVPSWSAISDPLHATVSDWEIDPRPGMPPEFYRRYEGPLAQLPSQVAFIRRSASAWIAAATQWDEQEIGLPVPSHAVFALITSGGPAEKPHIAAPMRLDGGRLPAILTPVESRPLLLGLEMVPVNDSGPAGRTRFAIDPPPRLSKGEAGQLAISDVVLARTTADSGLPKSIQETLARMYGTTQLVNPKQVALFWEVYGQADGDTVDVTLRIVRPDGSGRLARMAAAIGIGQVGPDSLTIHWREPRPNDLRATIDSGVTIHPRSILVDLSTLHEGDYTVEVRVDRRGSGAVSRPREFSIVRPEAGRGRGRPG